MVQVNGKKVSIPSYQLKEKDIVEPKNKELYKDVVPANLTWIQFDSKKIQGEIKHIPTREEIDTTVNESLIIEFYSR
jgi:small subunit ribosomal protein S4